MLCIGRGAGTIYGFRPDTYNAFPIPIVHKLQVAGMESMTLGKEYGQPTIYPVRGTNDDNTLRLTVPSNTTVWVCGAGAFQALLPGVTRDFNFSEGEGLLVIAF